MSKSKKKLPYLQAFNRRQFFSYSGSILGSAGLMGFGMDPIKMMMSALVDGLIAKAQAAGNGTSPKNYVTIISSGAATRWIWDGFLTPNNEPLNPDHPSSFRNLALNNYITDTKFTGDNTKTNYASTKFSLPGGDIWLPILWNAPIPVTGGGTIPMSSLLSNALIIRGFDMQVDLGHTFGPAKLLLPIGGVASLNGLVADASTAPIPVVGYGVGGNYADPRYGGYKSQKNIPPVLVQDMGDPLNLILSSFINSDAKVNAGSAKRNSAAMQNQMASAFTALGQFAKSSLPGSDVLYSDRSAAEKLFNTSFGDLKAIYSALYAKYYNLCKAARTTLTVPTTTVGNAVIIPPGNTSPVGTSTYTYNPINGFVPWGLAVQFAVTEYLLKNGYSSAITLSAGEAEFGGFPGNEDEHAAGPDSADRQRSLVCHSHKFIALSAMINELKNSLGPTIWNNTVVEYGGPFNRSPRADGSGSDHAPSANVVTLFSGSITQPTFMGNIYADNTNETYGGTWGNAAPTVNPNSPSGAGTPLTNNMVAVTVAKILGVQPPLTAVQPLVSIDSGGKVVSLVEKPKNVAGPNSRDG